MTAAHDTRSVAHDPGSHLLPVPSGELSIEATTRGWPGQILARRLGLATTPNSTTPGSLRIEPVDRGERWIREFGSQTWESILTPGDPDTIVEQAGHVTLRFVARLDSRRNTHLRLRSMHVGRIRVPIRRWFSICARIAPSAATRVTVRIPGGSFSYIATFIRAGRTVQGVER